MAYFSSGKDWFQSQPSGQQEVPTLENLMKPKAKKQGVAGGATTPVTFSLDELMKGTGQSTGTQTQSVQTVNPSTTQQGQVSAFDAGNPTDQPVNPQNPPPTASGTQGWTYDFPQYTGGQNTSFGGSQGVFYSGSQMAHDLSDAALEMYRKRVGGPLFETRSNYELAAEIVSINEQAFAPTMVTKRDANGIPMVTGYYNYRGVWVTTEDWSDVNRARQDYEDWIKNPANRPTSDYSQVNQSLADLLARYTGPDYLQNLQQAGMNWVDAFLGFGQGGFAAEQARFRSQLALGVDGQQGFTPQERADRERTLALQIQDAQNNTASVVAGMMAGGHGVAAIKQAEYLGGQLATAAAQGMDAISTEEYARKMAENESLMKQWGMLAEQGAMSMGQYLNAVQNQAVTTLGVIGTQMSAIATEFQEDMGIWTQIANAKYNGVLLTMNYHTLASGTELNDYEAMMARLQRQADAALAAQQAAANQMDLTPFIQSMAALMNALSLMNKNT